jgi:hypothetical protein
MNMFKRPVRVACLIRIRAGAGVWTAELIYPEHWPEPLCDATAAQHILTQFSAILDKIRKIFI